MDKIYKHFKAAAFLLTLLTLAAVSGCYYDRDPVQLAVFKLGKQS